MSDSINEANNSETKAQVEPDTAPSPSPHRGASAGGSWDMAFMSGLVAGIIMAIAYSNIGGPSAFLVAAFAYGFCIQNGNFAFSGFQKLFATILMLVIGTQWQSILGLLKQVR
jgi:hypothetical protein